MTSALGSSYFCLPVIMCIEVSAFANVYQVFLKELTAGEVTVFSVILRFSTAKRIFPKVVKAVTIITSSELPPI